MELCSLDKRQASLGNDEFRSTLDMKIIDHRDVEKVLEWLGYGWGQAISPSDRKFLYDVNLSDLIKKHLAPKNYPSKTRLN